MSKRKILYGYQMQNGTMAVREDEALIVRRIFTAYLSGMSYQAVADVLNKDGIPFDGSDSTWDKHKVKRVLEDVRYTGQKVFPKIIDIEIFNAVKEAILDKRSNRSMKSKSEVEVIWPKLSCAQCHGKLYRVGGGKQPDGALLLRCDHCGMTMKMSSDMLLQKVKINIMECGEKSRGQEQTSEMLQIQNAIARGLEHPEHPEQIISLIFQGISAQYENLKQDENALTEVDLRDFSQSILHIFLSDQLDVTVQFKG